VQFRQGILQVIQRHVMGVSDADRYALVYSLVEQ
jgi:hypothetical protein